MDYEQINIFLVCDDFGQPVVLDPEILATLREIIEANRAEIINGVASARRECIDHPFVIFSDYFSEPTNVQTSVDGWHSFSNLLECLYRDIHYSFSNYKPRPKTISD